MSDDPELLRLRAVERDAEHRYFRLKMALSDSATLEAAHQIWKDAMRVVQLYNSTGQKADE
jgi:hypothetical protein